MEPKEREDARGWRVLAGHTAYTTFKKDQNEFILQPIYIYSAVLFVGALHIFALPPNPLPKKTPSTKNNHGNFSDAIALSLCFVSLSWYFYPEHLFQDIGPLKAQFRSKSEDLLLMIRFVAGLILLVSLMLSSVKWTPINGQSSGMWNPCRWLHRVLHASGRRGCACAAIVLPVRACVAPGRLACICIPIEPSVARG